MPDEFRINTADGFALSARRFEPEIATGATMIVNAATGVKQKFYTTFAGHLTGNGIRTYTYDYRGIGESKPHRLSGFKASMADWGEKDQAAIIRFVREKHPNDKLILFGHSLGGQIIGLSPLSGEADKIVMVGSQTPFWKNYHGVTGFKVWLLWHFLIPVFTPIAGFFPSRKLGLFEDLPAGAARQWARWGKSRGYLFGELPHKKTLYQSLRKPALFFSFDDDPYAPKDAVLDLIKFYPNLNFDHRHIVPREMGLESIGHWSFFRKPVGELFWPSLIQWIEKKEPALPAR